MKMKTSSSHSLCKSSMMARQIVELLGLDLKEDLFEKPKQIDATKRRTNSYSTNLQNHLAEESLLIPTPGFYRSLKIESVNLLL